jgi:hypothetical protein
MAAIYLQHPVHGTKVATLEQEAVYDEGHGWTRYTVDAPEPAPVAAPSVEPEPDAEPLAYVVTSTNGMQPENAMPKPRRKRSVVVEP